MSEVKKRGADVLRPEAKRRGCRRRCPDTSEKKKRPMSHPGDKSGLEKFDWGFNRTGSRGSTSKPQTSLRLGGVSACKFKIHKPGTKREKRSGGEGDD